MSTWQQITIWRLMLTDPTGLSYRHWEAWLKKLEAKYNG